MGINTILKSARPNLGNTCAFSPLDFTATDNAELTGLSVRSTNTIYQRIRLRMAGVCTAQSPFLDELEADQSRQTPKKSIKDSFH